MLLSERGLAMVEDFKEFLLLMVVALAALLLAGCDAQELERIRAEAEANKRIALACTPKVGERVIAEWIIRDEKQALSFTVQTYVGQSKGAFQYVMLREDVLP